jgi:hypothetical protein
MPPNDGELELPIESGETEMAIDLPENVAGALLKEGSESHQALMVDVRGNVATANNLARLGATRQFNELDTIESRAHSGIMATPVASPTTQQ